MEAAAVTGYAPEAGPLWAGVERLVDRAATPRDLRKHQLELFAARRLRERGLPVPAAFREEERRAQLATLVAPLLLERVRAACDGPLVVLKGPEVAAAYPDPSLRRFGDVDLLAPDAERTQAELLAAGFEPIGDPARYAGIHHLRPLRCPGLPLHVEVHAHPKWVARLSPPATAELLAAAVPSASGVEGMLAPSPEHHALLLAAHSWAHEPLRRLRDVVDVAAVTALADRGEIARIARAWGADRLWRTTIAAADAVLLGGPEPWPLRTWARSLRHVRERTVLEEHLQRWLSSFALLPPHRALATLAGTLQRELRPAPDEPVATKLRRTASAVRNASRARSEHDAMTASRADPGADRPSYHGRARSR